MPRRYLIPKFFQELPGQRLLLTVIMMVIVGESLFGAYSVALLIPLAQAVVSSDAGFSLPGLPESMGRWLTGLHPAWTFAIFGAILIGKVVMTYGRAIGEALLVRRLRNEWTDSLCRHYVHQPMLVAGKQKQGEIINLLVREISRACNYVTASLTYLASLMCFVAIAGIVAIADWRLLAGGGAIGIAFYFLLLRPLFRFSRANGIAMQLMNRDLTSLIAETINAMKDIKILNMERFRLERIARQTRNTSRQEFHYSLIQDLPPNITELGFAIAVIILAVYLTVGGIPNLRDALPGLVFTAVAFYRLVGHAANLAGQQVRITNRHSSFLSVCHLTRLPHHEDLASGRTIEALTTDIHFADVTVRFDQGISVFENLAVTIPRGKTIYLCGPSGAGKSTLLDLLTRLLRPTTGSITANGVEISQFSHSSWRRLFGYVSQEPFIFSGTVMENIRIGTTSIDDQTARWAARIAGADDFITQMPSGYDTVLDEKGSNISGGQRRRLALARALARKPAILILDEATSAVEASLERQIILDLRSIPELTILIVSHRADNEDLADLIIDVGAGTATPRGDQAR